MLKKTALEYFGSVTKLARVLDLTAQAVYQWGDIVPEGNAFKLQALTRGALEVDAALYPPKPVESAESILAQAR